MVWWCREWEFLLTVRKVGGVGEDMARIRSMWRGCKIRRIFLFAAVRNEMIGEKSYHLHVMASVCLKLL